MLKKLIFSQKDALLLVGDEFIQFFLAVLPPLPSIFSALFEDSAKVSFQRGFARYLLASKSTCARCRSNVRSKG